jgi:hypothetical protein
MENLIQYLTSPPDFSWFFTVKLVFIGASVFLFGAIISILFAGSWIKWLLLYDVTEFFTYKPYGVKKLEKAWKKVLARTETGLESEYKLAVIEADSMLDDILKRMGFSGETLEEKLGKLTAVTLPNIEEIRESHRVRNNIVHDPDYRLSLDGSRKILGVYEQAFKELQAF